MTNTEHTSKQFDAELEAVRARVLHMGGLVEEQIKLALDALISGDLELCTKVENNDHMVNGLEVGIDEDCSTIIARPASSTRAPQAAGSARAQEVSTTTSQLAPKLAPGRVKVTGALCALTSSRKSWSCTDSPLGPGSVIAEPFRNTPSDLA